jgi:hypothetical protein
MAQAQDAQDRQAGSGLYFTLSLHLDNDNIMRKAPELYRSLSTQPPPADDQPFRPVDTDARRRRQIEIQQSCPPAARGTPLSIQLANAIEPMFHDIADRERLGVVEDFLIAIPATPGSEHIEDALGVDLSFTGAVSWQTEGTKYRAEVGGEAGSVTIDGIAIKRFWYVHRNFSLSYHLSFKILDYPHTPASFLLFSVLQKLVSPKEFALQSAPAPGEFVRIERGRTPSIAPFLAIGLRRQGDAGYVDFWQFVLDLFEQDFDALCRSATGQTLPRSLAAWDSGILKHEPYVEVPGLRMPDARAMFYFADEVFLNLLLPEYSDGAPANRYDMLREEFFDGELAAALDPDAAACQVSRSGGSEITIGAPFWSWLDEVQRAWERSLPPPAPAAPGTVSAGPIDPAWFEAREGDSSEARRGRDPARSRRGERLATNLPLAYMFLSGFNQNIIDFVNQDASEILDSMDPIYPATADTVAEGFFCRFANPRALITYVRKMRSLETGAKYIGTCPYAFLVHVLTLHNEFLARDFENRANLALTAASREVHGKRLAAAADIFYRFREREMAEYDTHLYDNVFRYDTERDVFGELQTIRGVALKHGHVMKLIDAAEKRTRDNEERLRLAAEDRRRADEQTLNQLVFIVGLFSILQVTFLIADQVTPGAGILGLWAARPDDGTTTWMFLHAGRLIALLSAAAGLILTARVIWQSLRERWRRRR